ncbi:hypothetical protein SAMN04515667_0952 [Formosa sp. Hel1_31_208]|uniref:hypothetical protein n=1 Tax=Formosa sp. Hel1_31_208 TaxID=1798225 RepID=UPI00087DCEB5|nr:hypothetical protein [Formosa sp. Hel1_31_208]SDR90402.1 hypothetical protein SAMN04515667_0952 [Formosa sp. Hel1_31_208]
MNRKNNPKNKNITVRVNERQYWEFNEIAHSHDLSVSEWANHLLSKHKNSYGKTENKEELIEGIDLTIKKMEFICQVLEKLKSEYKTFYDKTVDLAITNMKLTEKLIELKKFKRKLQN